MTKPEYFCSIAIAQIGRVQDELSALGKLDRQCAAQLRYYEIIYVAGERSLPFLREAASTLSQLRNVRILFVSDDTSYYRRRFIAATEAIGDVVAITSPSEIEALNVPALAGEALETNQVLIARDNSGIHLSLAHIFLGAISGYHVRESDWRTLAIPRTRLLAILARPSAEIDLRFEPKDGLFPYIGKPAKPNRKSERVDIMRRAEFFTEIVSASSSRILKGFSLVSLLVMCLAIAYAIYGLFVFFTFADVQPGWLTTNLAQSGSVAFISLAFSLLSLGVARIADRLDGRAEGPIIDEIGNISFFDAMHDLNVETEGEKPRTGST